MKRSLEELQKRIAKVEGLVAGVRDALAQGGNQAEMGLNNITTAEDVIKRAKEILAVRLVLAS